jgi:hypothetical protein
MNVLLHYQAVVQACHQEDHMGITLPDVHRHHLCCIMCCCLPQHISIVASPWMVIQRCPQKKKKPSIKLITANIDQITWKIHGDQVT